MGKNVHPGGVEPAEEWLVIIVRLFHEFKRAIEELFVHSLHALLRQRPGVLDPLLADFSELLVQRGVIGSRGPAVEHAARTELLFEFRVLWIIGIFRLFFGVEVIEVAKELVESVDGGQEFVTVAKVVLAKLPTDVAHWFKQFRNRRILCLEPKWGSRQPNLRHSTTDG